MKRLLLPALILVASTARAAGITGAPLPASPFSRPVPARLAQYLQGQFPATRELDANNPYLSRGFAPWADMLPQDFDASKDLADKARVDKQAAKAVRTWIDALDAAVDRAVDDRDFGGLEHLSREMEQNARFIAFFADPRSHRRFDGARERARDYLPLSLTHRISEEVKRLTSGSQAWQPTPAPVLSEYPVARQAVALGEAIIHPQSVAQRDRALADMVRLVKRHPGENLAAATAAEILLGEYERLDREADAAYGAKLLKTLRKLSRHALSKHVAAAVAQRLVTGFSVVHPVGLAKTAARTAAAIAVDSEDKAVLETAKSALSAPNAGATPGIASTIPRATLDKAEKRVAKALKHLGRERSRSAAWVSGWIGMLGLIALGVPLGANENWILMMVPSAALNVLALYSGRWISLLAAHASIAGVILSVPLAGMSWSPIATAYVVVSSIAFFLTGIYHLRTKKTGITSIILTALASITAALLFFLAFGADRLEKAAQPLKDMFS